ncbi:sugar ABC transporter ATP-binding protein [Lichenicola cladoniae]|uniref:Sugar ABC transporter ATP-binding protein n=1 Tax=Lichenicola cladoniae TaxID=1484109 RepID=A0A6M8HUR0_9PROT|nr:sugar ABC transporter ATP-binding protein [Lichenicola cladoniae]NPD66220.1 sugar ABC transporter ATP-binding protein [Acetobacteraceae bacterium]QKE92078.1 sugar ABC transporter ATP-binding protein [Lichenicola cladoniae]
MTVPLLELRDVAKHFAGVKALDGVSLSIGAGEIHCLAGENGSGKSTLIKVISGINAVDRGAILIDGADVGAMTPRQAIALGVQVIYQDFSLFGNLTVAENLSIGAELRNRRRIVNWRRMREHAEAAVQRLGVHLDLDATVDSLPVSGRQLVAIARALMADPRLLIMDEPTTALTGREVATLFGVVRDIQARGIAILFVSHKMREMLDISERLSVMRSGRVVANGPIADFDEVAITRAMTGTDIAEEPYLWEPPADSQVSPLLEVDGLTVPGELQDVSLRLMPGEIVGISGLLGSGRTELALALFGMRPRYRGTISLDGRPIRLDSVRSAINQHIAYVPEDRLTEGLFLPETIDRNIIASSLDVLSRFGLMRTRAASDAAARTIRDMTIATPTGDRPVMQLSGGNQQRVVIGRWLLQEPRLLILNGPTVGVDVGSKAGIHRTIRALARERGLGVLMISDDLPELVGNCNRILVMHRGRLVEELAGHEPPRLRERRLSERLKALT